VTWPERALSELGTWHGGSTPSKTEPRYWADGKVPWLSPKDMGAEVLSGTRDHISSAAIDDGRARIVPAGSVALVVRSGILDRTVPVTVVPFATTLNQDMKALSPAPGVDARWVAWALRAQERQVLAEDRKSGTTVASLDSRKLFARRIPLPALSEQRRIVDILEDHLSRLDAGHALLGTVRVKLGSMLASALWRLEPTELRELRDVAAIQSGIQKQPKRIPRGNVRPFLRVANVGREGLDLDQIHFIEVFEGEDERYGLAPGDLLVVEGNGSASQIGRAAMWDGSIPQAVHQNHLIRVRPGRDLLPAYLELIWNGPSVRETLSRVSSSSSGLHTLSVAKLARLKIPVPPVQTQARLVAELTDLKASVARARRAASSAAARGATLRRALLNAAFSGHLTGCSPDTDRIEDLADASHDRR
jgi:type I restriction enzyme S subunit